MIIDSKGMMFEERRKKDRRKIEEKPSAEKAFTPPLKFTVVRAVFLYR